MNSQKELSDTATQLRAAITGLQIMSVMLEEVQKDGQKALLAVQQPQADVVFCAKLATQIQHVINLIALARTELPGLAEIQRHIAALTAPVVERITNDFGDKMRTHGHGENATLPKDHAHAIAV
jgi:hypothetical protein